MKSERRHQLQQNELADAVGHGLEHLMPYARAIALAVVGICVCVFAYSFATTRNRAYDSSASLDFLLATNNEDPESFQRITQDYADTTAGHWARQAQADHNLAAGIEAMFSDRDEAATFLKAATDNYQQIADSASDPLLKIRAKFGLAKALEAQGETDKAVAAYEEVAKASDSKVLVDQVTKRIELLKSKPMQEFYVWFRENQPKAAAITSPVLTDMQDIPDAPGQAALPKVDIGGDIPEVPAPPEMPEPPAPPEMPAPPAPPAPPESPGDLKLPSADSKPADSKPAAEDTKPDAPSGLNPPGSDAKPDDDDK